MSVTINVSDNTAEQLESLFGRNAENLDQKIGHLLVAEYRRRLARYGLTNRQFSEKYEMTFEEFERQEVVKQRGYTWEVESDAMNWETAVDGIETISRRLRDLIDG
ncbi:MAG: hypothetical protein R2844_10305 [Caldilineales bacterium]